MKNTLRVLLGMAALYCSSGCGDSAPGEALRKELQEGYRRLCSSEMNLELVTADRDTKVFLGHSQGNRGGKEDSVNPPYWVFITYNADGKPSAVEMHHADRNSSTYFSSDLEEGIFEACRETLSRRKVEVSLRKNIL